MIDRASDPMLPQPFRVRATRHETEDTFTVDLEPVNGSGLAPLSAGQFNMLYVFGVGKIPISISGNPAEIRVLAHTTRAVGNVTKAMRKLRKGSVLGVRGPYGTSWPIEQIEGSDVVIVAGGIGLAPLRPALHELIARREMYGRIVLLYGTRSPADILFKRELEQWRARFDLEVYVTVDRAMAGWRGNVGVVTSLIPKAPFDPTQTVALVCGPEIMMRFAMLELEKRGVRVDGMFLSLERNMKCAVGFCVHCQFGPHFICKDGPVFRYDRVKGLLGGREIHPINVRVGGFYRIPVRRELEPLVESLKWARDAAEETVRWAAAMPFPEFERDYEFVALSHSEEYPFNEGRLFSSRGLNIGASQYEDHFVEEQVPHSNALHSVHRQRGLYFVGPLARYSLNFGKLSPGAREAAAAAGLGPLCRNPFQGILVRAVEILYACDEALRLIDGYEVPDRPSIEVTSRAATGMAVTEAPRGILYHRYCIDDDGNTLDAKIIPPTSQNQKSIEQDLWHFVPRIADLPVEMLTWRCEQMIRNYDPCISCATHSIRIGRDRI